MGKRVGFAAVALAAAIAPTRAFAQTTGSVTGQVIDQATKRSLPDVQVSIVGTQRGALTNAQGRFTINGVPVGPRQIRVRRVGYSAVTNPVVIAAGEPATANFTLTAAATTLQEVTVNAITGQAQSRIQGGTNTGYINADSLPKGPITQFADVLQGKVAGVNLQSAAGSVGSSQRILIRGANSLSLSSEPLIYVDGVLSSNNKNGFSTGGQDFSRLNDINPEDIESVEILKGPSASAIYGSAAANGVILITTKRGQVGAPRYRAYVEAGPENDHNPYPLNYAALTTYTAGQPYYDIPDGGILNIQTILGKSAPYDICPNYRAATGACTQDAVISFNQFRDPRTTPFQTGSLSRAGLNVSGGNQALTYLLSADKNREFGVLRPNDIDRTSVRTNFSARVGTNATVNVQANYVTSNTVRINNDNSIFSPLIGAYLGTAQYIPGMESDTVGTPGNRLGSYFGYNNADVRNVTVGQGVDRFIIGAQANYTPLGWLRINGNVGLDNVNTLDQETLDPKFQIPLAQSYILGFRQAQRNSQHVYTANASGTGTFNLTSELQSTSTLGAIYQENRSTGVYCYGVAIPSGLSSCSATATQFAVSEPYSDFKTVGAFARQEFGYAERLFISGALRADNNSGLGGGLSYFPQLQGSWVLSKESFFPRTPAVSLFRLRAAYGQAGQRPGYGQALTSYSNYGALAGGNENSAILLNNVGNPSLKLERTREAEAGFDAGLGGDRVTFEYTYYNKRSNDALIARPLPPSLGLTAGPNAALGNTSYAGLSQVYSNLGSITNKGNEFGLGLNLVNTKDFTFSTRLTATTLANHIVTLGNNTPPIVFNRGAQAHRVGFPAGAFFGTPITWNDANHDGKLAISEVHVDSSQFLPGQNFAYLGPALPTNTQGLSFDVSLLGNFHISTLFERRAGNKQLNYTTYFRCRTQNANPYYGECSALSDPTASLSSQAAFIASQYSQFGATPSGYIEDARFVKWRELTVRYDIPQSIASRYFRVRNGLSFSVSGRNLKTWTPYTGVDPEINESGGGALFSQDEFNTQPQVRVITFRIDVQP